MDCRQVDGRKMLLCTEEKGSRKGISLTMGYCHPLRRKKALAESRNNEACNEMTKSFRPITKHITKTREKKSGKRRRGSFRYFSRQLERKSGYVEESVLKKCMIIQSVQTQFVSIYVNINSIFWLLFLIFASNKTCWNILQSFHW